MTILIVDDHPIVRKGIHALLASAFADAEVMDASCLKEAEEACSTRDVNIMITDLDLNGESGLTLIRRVRDILPSLQIVIYTMHEEPWSVCQIADIDTEGVVMKSDNA
ncbi:MAG: response regulator transcription factor, partial [Prevotella sp.]|nr:response regulator transcription factor [Prevotella sp.]